MPPASSDINSQEMVGASNKPFDYMARGLALLVSDLPDWRATYVDQGFARACDPDSVDSLEQNLRWFLDHPDEVRRMGDRGRDRIRRAWNYEESFAPVLAHMRAPAHAAEASPGPLTAPRPRGGEASPFFSVCIPQYRNRDLVLDRGLPHARSPELSRLRGLHFRRLFERRTGGRPARVTSSRLACRSSTNAATGMAVTTRTCGPRWPWPRAATASCWATTMD